MYNANSQPSIDRFMETFNKTISNFETKPYEILQDNIEFLQNELRSKDEIIQTLMETQTAVLENLPLNKLPQQTENNTSFHDSPQKDVNKMSTNQIKTSSSKDKRIRSITIIKLTIIKNLNKKRDSILEILIRMFKSKTLSSFLASMQPHTCRKIVVLTYRLGKMGKIKSLALQ